jgi:cytochrome c-type biogenesis protein CcmE
MKKSRQRLYFILLALCCLSAAAALTLTALKDNISYFKTPTEALSMSPGQVFRLGGMVKKGSVHSRSANLVVTFTVTDFDTDTRVSYNGFLPDLFREGQGVIAKGALDGKHVFVATEILAKHDEKYMPPEIKKALGK